MENTSKQYFEAVASEWDSMRKGFFPESVREQALLAAGVQAGQMAADLGAGSGFVTEALRKAEVDVIAVDQSEAMIEVLQKKFGAQVDARLGTAEALPIAKETLDHAFANMYLHHVDDPAGAIKEAARVLKPGGRLTITDMDAHSYKWLRDEHHDRWMGFARNDVKQWFEQAGFVDVTVGDVGDNCSCDSSTCCETETAAVTIFIATGTKA